MRQRVRDARYTHTLTYSDRGGRRGRCGSGDSAQRHRARQRDRQSETERHTERERERGRDARQRQPSRSRNSLVWRVAPSSQPAVSGAYRQRDGRKIRPVGLGRACVSLGAQCHGPLATLSHNALGFSLSLSLSLSASLFLCVSLPLPASLFHSFLLSLSPSVSVPLPFSLCHSCYSIVRLSTALIASPSHHPSPLPPQSAPHCDLRGRDRRARVVGSLATPHQLSRSTRRCSGSPGGRGRQRDRGEGRGREGAVHACWPQRQRGAEGVGAWERGGADIGAEGAERQRSTRPGNSLCASLSLSARVSPFLRPPPAPGRSRQTRRQWHRREAHRGGGGRQSGSSSTVSRMPKSQQQLQV